MIYRTPTVLSLRTDTPENVDVFYQMVVDADDTYLKFSNPRICQASVDVTDNSTIGAFYRFSPELEQEDCWFMDQDIELISESGDNGIQFKELRDVCFDKSRPAES